LGAGGREFESLYPDTTGLLSNFGGSPFFLPSPPDKPDLIPIPTDGG